MKGLVGGSLVVASVLTLSFFESGDAGKTIKLPYYDVTFGSWPLMEVTKTGRAFPKPRPKAKSIGGGPPREAKSIGGGPPRGKAIRLGPPPPGKLVLINPGDKGMLHQQLQANLKYFVDKPVNLNLPIIVKAPGPNVPPPPPGYKLGGPNGGPPPEFKAGPPNGPPSGYKPGPPNGGPPLKLTDGKPWTPGPPNGGPPGGPPPLKLTNNNNAWQPGPPNHGPPHPGPDFAPNHYQGPKKTSRLFSLLKSMATFGILGQGYDTYRDPEFTPEFPPFPGPYITNYPNGTQVTTYVNDGVMPGPGSPIEAKPSVPPVIKIGDDPPDNYKVIFAQRSIVGLKSPDTLGNSGNTGTSEYDAALNLGGNYEQGYGAPPPDHPPLLIQKFQKRGDHPSVAKLVSQQLPDTNLISTVNILVSTPNISAPLGGKNSPLFQAGLEDKRNALKLTRNKEQPLDAQVKLLGRLFTKLQRLKPPKIAVPEDELDEGYKTGGDEDQDGWKKVAKSKVDSPVLAVQIQTYSDPEINSSDPDIVESMAEFGNHDVKFADSDAIVDLMEAVMSQGSSRMKLRDLGSNPEEINDNMLSWVRRHLTMARDVNHQAHSRGEELASKQFRQYQTFVGQPGGGNGWGPSEPLVEDPKRGSKTLPMSYTHMGASMSPNINRKRR